MYLTADDGTLTKHGSFEDEGCVCRGVAGAIEIKVSEFATGWEDGWLVLILPESGDSWASGTHSTVGGVDGKGLGCCS
jgi:hypothetical protein